MEGKLNSLSHTLILKIESGSGYDALQYFQSFIVRKRKSFNREELSELFFFAVKLFIDRDSLNNSIALLQWFIKGGAGSDCIFSLNGTTDDLGKLISLLRAYEINIVAPIIEQTYVILNEKFAMSNRAEKVLLQGKMDEFESLSLSAFEALKNWPSAVKAAIKLNKVNVLVRLTHLWASEGYPNEFPLFFARVVLVLLTENKLEQASSFLKEAQFVYADLLGENLTYKSTNDSDAFQFYLTSWHLAIIITELISLPSSTRSGVNIKVEIFSVIYERYASLLDKMDAKIVKILEKIGEIYFGFTIYPRGSVGRGLDDGFNPLSILSDVFSGFRNRSNMDNIPLNMSLK